MMTRTFDIDKTTESLWRIVFNNPPINLIDAAMIEDLRAVLGTIERNQGPAVLLFTSADADYFLAHFDTSPKTLESVKALPPGPTGLHPWLDVLVRISKLPAVTISAIRGRARGAGSEFVLATDIRFASSERAILGQPEVGFGLIPGGGPASRLPGLAGRGRTLEILLGGDDFDGELAERYGYVNRAIPDAQFEHFVNKFARRVAGFDRHALTEIKRFVNQATLPNDDVFAPQLQAFFGAAAQEQTRARVMRFFELGANQRSDIEYHLGRQLESL